MVEINGVTKAHLNVWVSLIAGTKLSATPLFFTVRKELWISQYSYSLAIIDQCNGSRASQCLLVLITDWKNYWYALTDYAICGDGRIISLKHLYCTTLRNNDLIYNSRNKLLLFLNTPAAF